MNTRNIELSDTAFDGVAFHIDQSDPKNVDMLYSAGSKVTDAQGKVTFEGLKSGVYDVMVDTGPFNNAADVMVDLTSNQDVLVNVSPLYTVKVLVTDTSGTAVADATVELIGTGSLTQTTDTSGIASFESVHEGDFAVRIKKENFEDLSTTGTISGSAEVVELEYTINIMPKLVLVTTAQSNYALDTAYKYVSMLVVGKGAVAQPGFSWTYPVPGTGGGSGMLVYYKNRELSNFRDGTITIQRSTYLATEGTEVYGWVLTGPPGHQYSSVFRAFAGDCTEANGATVYNNEWEPDGYGSSGGGGTYLRSGMSAYYNYGGGGSRAAGANAESGWKNGGDGTFGFGGTAAVPSGNSTGATKGVIIPVQSVFGGTARGGYPDVGTTTGRGGGGAGYGDGGGNQSGGLKGGYGAGAGFDPTQSAAEASDWIVCLYYHESPLE